MCLYPKIIKNRKYIPNKKNNGIAPTVKDKRTLYVPVGCGKCMECKKQKARSWSVRLQEEIKTNKNGKFVTLTFSDEAIKKYSKKINTLEGYERENEIATIAIRRFLENWRYKHKKSVKHWLVTELGHEGTENIHLHGIIWTDNTEEIERTWKKNGYVWIGEYVNEKTINYIVKYVNKPDEKHKEFNSKILTSSGIGKNYINTTNAKLNKYKEKNTKETYITRNGIKLNLPIYYRNKIYTEEEREKLWIEKLDKNIRYINGEKIKINKNEEEYFKALEYHRKINKKLKYGNNEINWNKKRYEREQANLRHNKRIDKKH